MLHQQVASAGDHQKGVLRVGQGCERAITVALTVTLPAPMVCVKPMVKPGWTVGMRSEQPTQPLMNHVKPATEAVVDVELARRPAGRRTQ